MTFLEAQQTAKKYDVLLGQISLSGEAITAIVIQDGVHGYQPFAFYYKGTSSAVGLDPLEWYKDRPLSGKRRSFKVYEPNVGGLPWSIVSLGDVIVQSKEEWMFGKTLKDVKPYLIEKKVTISDTVY